MSTLKCLSLWQPWASLMLIPDPDHPLGCEVHQLRGKAFYSRAAKSFETRSWSTNHRGVLLIHAAKRWTREEQSICSLFRHKVRDLPATPPLGSILGYVDLTGCRPTIDVLQRVPPDADELAFGNYGPRRFAWECLHPRRFAVPIPYRGRQGLFDVPVDVVQGRVLA